MTAAPPDRAAILAAVMPALLGAQAPGPVEDEEETGVDTVVTVTPGLVAGLAVAREAFSRLGARCRPLIEDGIAVEPGDVVAELGGPIAAIRGAAPVALAFLGRLSAIASGTAASDPDDPLERYAEGFEVGRLSPSAVVDHDGPSFRLGSEE